MSFINKSIFIAATSFAIPPVAAADNFTEALTGGKVNVNARLRYEEADQDNSLKDASALTLRTHLAYTTASFHGLSAKVEVEDNRVVLGRDDYSVPPVGFNTGEYSVIADPEFTEVDQAYLQYTADGLTARLGRQVITFDNHRFVGHVGWRQDRQVFDAFSLKYDVNKNVSLNYAHIDERERIFAEQADKDSADNLVNLSWTTPVGKLTGYSYLLQEDGGNADVGIDTYGLRFSGAKATGDLKVLYTAEFAKQQWDKEGASQDFDADYILAELGVVAKGVTAKVGYESLGSDDGMYGFSTPLATLHKFNGWNDVFLNTPAQGLVDAYVSVAGKVAGGKLVVVYHDFSADDATATVDDYGREWNAQYTYKFAKHYTLGMKYANYSADDFSVDTNKFWLWLQAAF